MVRKPTVREICTLSERRCTLCGETRLIDEFYVVKRRGNWVVSSWCSTCCRKRKKDYYQSHREKCIEYSRQYSKEHSVWQKQYKKKYACLNARKIKEAKADHYQKNKTRYAEKSKKYIQKNREEVRRYHREYNREKRKTDPQFAVAARLRHRLKTVLRNRNVDKMERTFALVGCSKSQLVAHLESKFKEGMTWENAGLRGWHIDHVRPCASFNLTDLEQQKACFHYSNLQPMWANDNLSKGCKHRP